MEPAAGSPHARSPIDQAEPVPKSAALGIRWHQFLLAAWIGKVVQGIAIAFAGSLSIGWVAQFLG